MDSMGLTRYMSALMDDALKQERFSQHGSYQQLDPLYQQGRVEGG